MKPPVQIGLLLLYMGAAVSAAEIQPAVMVESLSPFQPVLGGSAFSEAGESGGNVFSVFPLNHWLGWDGGVQDRVLFLEPLINWQEGGAFSGSLGLGYRQLFGDPTQGKSRFSKDIDLLGEGWHLGGNVFLEGMNSVHDQGHWQISSGVEIGSRYLSFHANYYWPLSGSQRWGTRITPTGEDDYRLSISDPHAPHPLQPTGGLVRDITLSRFHHLQTLGLYEEALQGWDVGTSLLVPVIDKYVDLRFVAGLYGFDGGTPGQDFNGWRAGVEFRPVPAVVLMAAQFSDDRFEESQWLAGVRFEIPLGGKPSDWLRIRQRTLRERLMEPVDRRYVPVIASSIKPDKGAENVARTPFNVRSLNLSHVPRPGDVIKLEDGTLLLVETDGKTLREVKSSRHHRILTENEPDLTVPEPGRTLLMIFGVAAMLFRRRRSA